MYSYIYFSLALLGLFLIIEIFKGGQKLSLIKLNFLFLLLGNITANVIDFANLINSNLDLYGSIIRVLNTIFIVNIFHLLANNKKHKLLITIELLFILIFIFAIYNGYRFTIVNEGQFIFNAIPFSAINIFIVNPIIVVYMAFNLFKILKVTDSNNLYQKKIRIWSVLLFILFLISLIAIIVSLFLYLNQIILRQFDSRWIYILNRFTIILFIFFRPRFIDEIGISFLKSPSLANGQITLQNFELLFYFNQYFLKSDANLDNFALMLNHTNAEVSDFIKKQTNDSFIELINKNRITYLKELLKSKQHESFTIEALSEMSGFNNRQSMYNAFKKFEGCSPSEYINCL